MKSSPQESFTDEPGMKKRGKLMTIIGKIWRLEEDKVEAKDDKELYVKQTFTELMVYSIFVIIVCIISFIMASTDMYYYTKVMMDLFLETEANGVRFKDITTMKHFWSFTMGALMDGLYWTEWYNKKDKPPFDGLIYYENRLIGPPRLRQVRVLNNSCEVPDEFKTIIQDCYNEYDEDYEDKYFDLKRQGSNADTKDAWEFKSKSLLDGEGFKTLNWYTGKVATYPKSGYVQDFSMKREITVQRLEDLKSNLWLRRGARAVFITFTIYNANINLFCVITLCVEFPPTGGAEPSWSFQTVKLLRYVTQTDYFVLGCEIIFVLFIIYYLMEELLEICTTGRVYFGDFWNLLDLLLILFALLCIAMNISRVISVSHKLGELDINSEHYQDFEFLGNIETVFNNFVAALVFFTWVKVFKYISFNKTMTQLSTTLSRCSKDLYGFLMMFSIVFVAFTMLGHLLFQGQIKDFSTFHDAFFTLFRIILGDFNFQQLEEANRILGPIFFMVFVFFVFFVLINMFLAIINDTYSEVKSDMAKQVDVFIMSDYVKQVVNRFLDKLVNTKEKLEGIEKYLHGESGTKSVSFEEWRSELKKQGYDDQEIEDVFVKYDLDKDNTLNPDEQRNMLYELDRSKGIFKKEKKKESNVTSFGDQEIEEISEDENEEKEVVSHDQLDTLYERVERLEEMMFTIVNKVEACRTHLCP